MTRRTSLDLTLRIAASAADSRRGIVRVHPDVLLALGLREWDAVEIIGARTTGAVVAATPPQAPAAILVIDEVVSANCGLGEDAVVSVRAAAVTGATSVQVQGLPPAAADLPARLLRSALLGKVVRVGDSVTLQPRDLGPDFPTGETTTSLRNLMGMTWSTQLLTVTATEPGGIVSVQPTTSVTAGAPTRPAPGESSGGTTDDAGAVPTTTPVGTSPPPSDREPRDHGETDSSTAAIEHVPTEDLVGLRERAEVLRQWLGLALDRADLLRSLGASPHLGVMVAGPLGLCFLPAFVCLGVVPVVLGLAGDILPGIAP